jgi:hypothetical protein
MKKCTLMLIVSGFLCVEQLHPMKLLKSMKTFSSLSCKNYTKKLGNQDACDTAICHCKYQNLPHFFQFYAAFGLEKFSTYFEKSYDRSGSSCQETLRNLVHDEFSRCAEYGVKPSDLLFQMHALLENFEMRKHKSLSFHEDLCYDNCRNDCDQCFHDFD